MKKRVSNGWKACLLAGAMTFGAAGSVAGQTMPKAGDAAPDFKLSYFDGKDLKEVSLEQYRGKKNVVVAFFIFAFTGG
jgi:peroxiredoxin